MQARSTAASPSFIIPPAHSFGMPWTKQDYPDSMKDLDTPVRNKAIEIANTLVEEENMDEGRAIAIATSQAKKSVKGNGD